MVVTDQKERGYQKSVMGEQMQKDTGSRTN
jgi:hypothetical protein